jgi:hypothetical protein
MVLRQGLPNYLLGLALNQILLISGSWVARIIGVNSQCPAKTKQNKQEHLYKTRGTTAFP